MFKNEASRKDKSNRVRLYFGFVVLLLLSEAGWSAITQRTLPPFRKPPLFWGTFQAP